MDLGGLSNALIRISMTWLVPVHSGIEPFGSFSVAHSQLVSCPDWEIDLQIGLSNVGQN